MYIMIFNSTDNRIISLRRAVDSSRHENTCEFFTLHTLERIKYTGAPTVGIARWSVPRIGQGHLEVKW